MENTQVISNQTVTEQPVLTSREREVTRFLAQGQTVRQVAAQLGLSFKTVETHKGNMMRKLALHDRQALKSYAVNAGLVQLSVV